VTLEEEFDTRWADWLDSAPDWHPFFEELASLSSSDLILALQHFELVNDHDLVAYGHLRLSAAGRAVPLPRPFSGREDDVALLALGFARGEVGALAVPFAPKADS
jgi:hypothetical protein